MSSGFGTGDGMRHARRVVAMLAFAIIALAAMAFSGCTSAKTHDVALVAASQGLELTVARNDEQRAFVLAVDARERANLDEKLDLIAQIGELQIESQFARDLANATVLLAPASGAGSPSASSDSRPSGQLDDGAPALRVVEAGTVARLVAKQNADRAATRAAVAAKRREITAQLDRELKAWLEDPKAREAERIAFMMTSYARQESEFARFWQDVGARVGVQFPGAKP